MNDQIRTGSVLPAPLYDALFEQHPHALIALDASGHVLAVNASASALTRIVPGDIVQTPVHGAEGLSDGAAWSGTVTAGAAAWPARTLPVASGAAATGIRILVLSPAVATAEAAPRDAADAAPVMIWTVDAFGQFDWFNERAREFSGRSLDELRGAGWLTRVHPEDAERCVAIFRTSFDERHPFSMDYRLRRHDGQYRWVLESGVPRHAADGSFAGYIGTAIDIHERKELEERLADHTQTLRLADRRQNEFLAMLSHQLRSPLAPIANAASVLRTLEGGNPTLLRLREIIDRQVGRLRRLVDDLIDVTRVMQGQITLVKGRVSVHELLRSAAETSQSKLDAGGHTLRIDVPNGPLWVQGDSVRLAQALGNIVTNAATFNPSPSVISVGVHTQGDTLEIAVRDEGEGITSEFLPYVFDLFSRQDLQPGRMRDGLGLGLPLARRVVQLHGGDVKAFSEGAGRGAEFILSLPLAPVDPQADDAHAAATIDAGHRVLLIESNPDTRYLMRLQIELWGHQVAAAGSLEESLKLVDGFRPQAVLLDLDGAEATRPNGLAPLRAKLPVGTPFIALAAYGHDEHEANARAAGFDATLVKPLRPESLSALLTRPSPAVTATP